jgi:hypothetical protein
MAIARDADAIEMRAPSRRRDMKTLSMLHRPEPTTPDVDPDPPPPGHDDPVDPPVPDGLPQGDPPSHPPPMRMPGGDASQPSARTLIKGGPSWTFTCNRQTSARSLRCWAATSNRARCAITSRNCRAACCRSAFASQKQLALGRLADGFSRMMSTRSPAALAGDYHVERF